MLKELSGDTLERAERTGRLIHRSGFLGAGARVIGQGALSVNTLIQFLALTTRFGVGYAIVRRVSAGRRWPRIGLVVHGVFTPLIYLRGFP